MGENRVKVLDCTVRDGGLINNHLFDHSFVGQVYASLCEAHVDFVELGYQNSRKFFEGDGYGPWKFCEDKDLRTVIQKIDSPTRLSVMVDVGRVDVDEIPLKEDSLVDLIRVAAYAIDVEEALGLIRAFHKKGYMTSLNIMAVSRDRGPLLVDALRRTRDAEGLDIVYIVDSFGALYPSATGELVALFQEHLPGKPLGFHGHNHLQLAFGNAIEAIQKGVEYVDGTVYGIGRAAGNCPLELLLGFLNDPCFDLRPILDLISKEFVPLKERLEWGYRIPFVLTGLMNQHPRAAMTLRKSEDKEAYRSFYDRLAAENRETGP